MENLWSLQYWHATHGPILALWRPGRPASQSNAEGQSATVQPTVILSSNLESEEGTNNEQSALEPASEVLTDDEQPGPVPPDGLLSEQAKEVGQNSKQQTWLKMWVRNYHSLPMQELGGLQKE